MNKVSPREIKFRAWDGNYKRMVQGKDAGDVGKRTYYPFQFDIGYSGYNPKKVKLLQFTGLKDKNGVEIYEGDKVEHRNYIGELLGSYEVRSGAWGFTLYDPKKPEVLSHYISPDQLEVVGNIYE